MRADNSASGDTTPELALVRPVARVVRRGPYTLLCVRDPGAKFDASAKRDLMGMIARESVPMLEGVDIRASYWGARPNYHDTLDEWIVAEHNGRLVGWCGARYWRTDDGPLLYFDTLGVMPGHRRGGVGAIMTFEAWFHYWRGRGRFPSLALRTQSPVIYVALRRLVPTRCYPQLGAVRLDFSPRATRMLERAVAETSPGKDFDARTGVVFGAVPAGSLYGERVPRSGDHAVDAFFTSQVDVAAGDALMAVFVARPWPRFAWAVATYLYLRLRVARSRPSSRTSSASGDERRQTAPAQIGEEGA